MNIIKILSPSFQKETFRDSTKAWVIPRVDQSLKCLSNQCFPSQEVWLHPRNLSLLVYFPSLSFNQQLNGRKLRKILKRHKLLSMLNKPKLKHRLSPKKLLWIWMKLKKSWLPCPKLSQQLHKSAKCPVELTFLNYKSNFRKRKMPERTLKVNWSN